MPKNNGKSKKSSGSFWSANATTWALRIFLMILTISFVAWLVMTFGSTIFNALKDLLGPFEAAGKALEAQISNCFPTNINVPCTTAGQCHSNSACINTKNCTCEGNRCKFCKTDADCTPRSCQQGKCQGSVLGGGCYLWLVGLGSLIGFVLVPLLTVLLNRRSPVIEKAEAISAGVKSKVTGKWLSEVEAKARENYKKKNPDEFDQDGNIKPEFKEKMETQIKSIVERATLNQKTNEATNVIRNSTKSQAEQKAEMNELQKAWEDNESVEKEQKEQEEELNEEAKEAGGDDAGEPNFDVPEVAGLSSLDSSMGQTPTSVATPRGNPIMPTTTTCGGIDYANLCEPPVIEVECAQDCFDPGFGCCNREAIYDCNWRSPNFGGLTACK